MVSKELVGVLSELEADLHRSVARPSREVNKLLHRDFEEVGRSGRRWEQKRRARPGKVAAALSQRFARYRKMSKTLAVGRVRLWEPAPISSHSLVRPN